MNILQVLEVLLYLYLIVAFICFACLVYVFTFAPRSPKITFRNKELHGIKKTVAFVSLLLITALLWPFLPLVVNRDKK